MPNNRYTNKSTLISCCLGYAVQAIVINLPALLFVIFQTHFNISLTNIANIAFFGFTVQLIVDILSVKIIDRIGFRVFVVGASVTSFMGLFMLGILPFVFENAYIGIMISVFVFSIGGGLSEVVLSPIVDTLSVDTKETTMSFLHSFYSWGQLFTVLVATGLIKIIGDEYWFIIPILFSTLPLWNSYRFMRVPLGKTLSKEEKTPLRELFSAKIFIVALIVMICGGACEMAMSQWSSYFAEKGLQVSKFTGDLLGPCLLALFMGIGRVAYGIWGNKINIKSALTVCSIIGCGCFLLTALSPNPVLSLVGCAISGLSTSIMWPGTLTLVSKKFRFGGASMFSILSIFGDVGCSLGSWLVGKISSIAINSSEIISFGMRYQLDAEQTALRFGMLTMVLFPFLMFICLRFFRKNENKDYN